MTAAVVYESAFNQIASITDLLSHTTAFAHESHGNLTQFTDRKQQETALVYDEFDRLAEVTYDDNSTTTNTHDLANRLTQVVDSISGTISLTHDNLDRLVQETTPQGTVGYTYDASGRTATMTITGQTEIAYSYDNANRLTQIAQGNSVTGFGYDAAGRRTSLTLPNAVVVAYTYDNAGQLTGIAYSSGGTPLGDLTYEYDAAGRRISIGGSFARTGLPQALASAVYDAANRLTEWGNATLTYDDNGNLTSDGVNAFVWDPRDRMASMTGATFQYDAFGRRIGKTVGGIATQFLYDGLNVAQELGDSPATLLTGLGFDEVFTRTDASGARFPLPDGLNSSLALTDANGAVQTSYTYEPFGMAAVTGTPNANPFQYTGRENDGTGLYYYRARYYNPNTGRFLSEDPLGFAGGGPNFYAYAGDDPVDFNDPFGQQALGAGYYLAPVPYGPGWSDQFLTGAIDMWVNYRRMEQKQWKGADKYYHCMANCQATNEGWGGAAAARVISFGRTDVVSRVREPDDWRNDDKANHCGQKGGDCQKRCAPYVPRSSPGKPAFPGW